MPLPVRKAIFPQTPKAESYRRVGKDKRWRLEDNSLSGTEMFLHC
jgi:hypothetical protein